MRISDWSSDVCSSDLVEGVGSVQVFASPYAMRIWLDPEKLTNYSLSAAEALAAVQEQNSQRPGGQIADPPIPGAPELTAAILTPSRLNTPAQFRNNIPRAQPDPTPSTLHTPAPLTLRPQPLPLAPPPHRNP